MRILCWTTHTLNGTTRGILTQRTLAYTNHTLLPEALEKWPAEWFAILLLSRHLEIIYEINRRLLVSIFLSRFPGDSQRVASMSLVEEGPKREIRMTNLAIVGSHSTTGRCNSFAPAQDDDGQRPRRDVSRTLQ